MFSFNYGASPFICGLPKSLTSDAVRLICFALYSHNARVNNANINDFIFGEIINIFQTELLFLLLSASRVESALSASYDAALATGKLFSWALCAVACFLNRFVNNRDLCMHFYLPGLRSRSFVKKDKEFRENDCRGRIVRAFRVIQSVNNSISVRRRANEFSVFARLWGNFSEVDVANTMKSFRCTFSWRNEKLRRVECS